MIRMGPVPPGFAYVFLRPGY